MTNVALEMEREATDSIVCRRSDAGKVYQSQRKRYSDAGRPWRLAVDDKLYQALRQI
ncbi:hypothetical protein KCP69_09660 [Salmonella enterica subsp. enterica]|nr:hypothetical protein KCP69_09660 [Salmonella enterica subsp. enterica]